MTLECSPRAENKTALKHPFDGVQGKRAGWRSRIAQFKPGHQPMPRTSFKGNARNFDSSISLRNRQFSGFANQIKALDFGNLARPWRNTGWPRNVLCG